MAEKHSIVSPLPGVFYRRPSPEEEVYVKEGQNVNEGDVIGLIEVMKNFYEVKAEQSGVLDKFSVENEQVVDAGQELAVLSTEE